MKTVLAAAALTLVACSSSSGGSQCAGQSCVTSADCCPAYSCVNYFCQSGADGGGTVGSSSSSSGGQGSTAGEASTSSGGASSTGAATTGRASSSTGAASTTGAGASSSGGGSTTGATTTTGGGSSSGGSTGGTCTSCPSGYACGTANGIAVCRNSQTGIPLFRHVFVIMMENTSASAITASATPYLSGLATQWATSSNYSGATDPSLPNYIAITSGDTQSITCDCNPNGASACQSFCINGLTNNCNCGGMTVTHLGDQIDKAGLTWKNYGESMGTDCNPNGASPYAPKHVPFLYYQDVLSNSSTTYCGDHVVDFGNHFAADLAGTTPTFSIIAPNLNDDMHGTGALQTSQDIANGDSWLGQQVPPILSSAAFSSSGIVFIAWDEGDGSIGLTLNGIPFYVLSPLAKKGGYVSSVKYDHYSLLATIEDGLGLARLGKAQGAAPLADFFPAQ